MQSISFLSKSPKRWSISSPCSRSYVHLLLLKTLHHPLRTYATTPQPRPYQHPKPPTNFSSAKAEVSTETSPIPLQSALPVQAPRSHINPPPSVHPPPLTLPDRAPSDPAYKYYFRLGKAYANFYKNGLKALWANYGVVRSLPNRLWYKDPTEISEAVKNGAISRADFQLIRRVKSDLYKLPPFMLLFMICGEFTPLVIVFVTGLVPRIIWLPKQRQNAREITEQRRRTSQQEGGFKQTAGAMILRNELSNLSGSSQNEAYKYIARSLGLYSPSLDRYIPALIPAAFIRRRVDRRLKDLEVDDFAIARDGGVQSLDKEEVIIACEERGMDVLNKEESRLREQLSRWVEERIRSSRD